MASHVPTSSSRGARTGRALLTIALLLVPALAACIGPTDEPAVTPAVDIPTPATAPPDTVPATTSRPDVEGGFSNTHVLPGDYVTEGLLSKVVTPGPYAVGAPGVLHLESSVDGATIEMGLVLPEVPDGTRVPVIAVASPYFVRMTPERFHGEGMPEAGLPHIWVHYQQIAENYVPHGYAAAFIAVRGSGGSGGCMDLFGPKETADVDQAITWLGTQDWSNGNVGMVGLSYSASTPWQVAALGNPHLKTIVPMAGLPSFLHFLTHDGAVHLGAHGGFSLTYWHLAFLHHDLLLERPLEQSVDGAACPELAPSLAATSIAAATLDEDPLGFFAAREHRPGVEANYDGSIFLVQGLDDWRVTPKNSYPWIWELEERGIVVKHLLGQWPHTFPDLPSAAEHRRWDFAETLLHWFDYWLKGDTTVDLGPKVQVQDQHGTWRSDTAWPPEDAEPLTLHLGDGGTLSTDGRRAGTVRVAADIERTPTLVDLIVDRRGLPDVDVDCAACPRFESDPFNDGLRFAGMPTLDLSVTPLGPTGHVAAHLFVVGADGAEDVVGRGLVDLRLAGGGEPQPVVPGEVLQVRLAFEPLDVVVPAGGRLVLVLHQGGYEERWGSLPPVAVDVGVGEGASTLSLAAFEVEPHNFFVPPMGAG